MHSIEKKIYLGLLVCLLVVSIGVSFAYFTGNVTTTGKGGSVDLDPASLIKVQYNAGSNALALENAIPGDGTSKDFSITVTPTKDEKTATFSIQLVIDQNTFVKCSDKNYDLATNGCMIDAEELVYTLTDQYGQQLATGDLLERTGSIELAKLTKTVNEQTTYHYTLNLSYKNTGAEQNHNTNKVLVGSVKVGFAK